MKRSSPTFRLFPAPTERDGEVVRIVSGNQSRSLAAPFNSSLLPSRRQIHCEIPFSVNFPLKLRPAT